MEAHVKEKLDLKVFKRGQSLSGCINKGYVYETDKGKLFVKSNLEAGANVAFRGEYESLKKLSETNTIKVPEPILIGESDEKSFIIMEYLNLTGLNRYSAKLGESLARLHLHNINELKRRERSENFIGFNPSGVDKFGFHVSTACGFLPQNNEWCDDWVAFYTRQKLQHQVDMIIKEKGSREIIELWSELQVRIPNFFKDVGDIKPSLLHGDLWCGNAGETESEPVIFDPASFYGHHEYDLAIAVMFGGFGKQFFNSYHNLIQKAGGFHKRQELYLLFHHLNHWNHFGSHKGSSLQIMKNLLK